jgi:hypothetical protein
MVMVSHEEAAPDNYLTERSDALQHNPLSPFSGFPVFT